MSDPEIAELLHFRGRFLSGLSTFLDHFKYLAYKKIYTDFKSSILSMRANEEFNKYLVILLNSEFSLYNEKNEKIKFINSDVEYKKVSNPSNFEQKKVLIHELINIAMEKEETSKYFRLIEEEFKKEGIFMIFIDYDATTPYPRDSEGKITGGKSRKSRKSRKSKKVRKSRKSKKVKKVKKSRKSRKN